MKNESKLNLRKRVVITLGAIVICIVAGITILFTVMGSNDNQTTNSSVLTTNKVTKSEKTDISPLYEDNFVKVTYSEIFEEPSLKGNCFLRLLVENKSNKKITVFLKDAYVNNMATLMGSGIPMTIDVGKKSQQPFTFSYSNLNIPNISSISDIQFKIWIVDDNTNTLEETKTLKVTP